MKIAFVWQGVSNPKIFQQWNDGLRQAMRIIEKEHEVIYCEPFDEINADLILYWEAPCTINGQNKDNWEKVRKSPIKKALLFAGGPLQKEWVEGFDHIFVESKINADECASLGLPHSIAFGINDEIFKPEIQPKVFDGIHQGTCASWKRQWLIGESLGPKGVVCGRFQETDRRPFEECIKQGSLVLPEIPAKAVCSLLNASHTMVQTSDFWGGGQRATLEALACGIPVICMSDSPKNREFVEESGCGEVVNPTKEQIRLAIERIKENTNLGQQGIEYVKSKWTAQHYANNLLKVINSL